MLGGAAEAPITSSDRIDDEALFQECALDARFHTAPSQFD